MLSEEALERIRRMTPAEKWAAVLELADYGWEMLQRLPPEERERRLEILRRERQRVNDEIARSLR